MCSRPLLTVALGGQRVAAVSELDAGAAAALAAHKVHVLDEGLHAAHAHHGPADAGQVALGRRICMGISDASCVCVSR